MPKLLLRRDVPSLGRIGDVVNVSEGYARNYLLPHGVAVHPTPGNLKKIEEEKKAYEARRAKELAEKRELANRLQGFEVTISGRANEQGHLFGSVGPKEIAAALAEEGYNIGAEQVVLEEHLKQVGKYEVTIRFADEVTCTLNVWAVAEKVEGAEPGDQPPADLDYDDAQQDRAEDENT